MDEPGVLLNSYLPCSTTSANTLPMDRIKKSHHENELLQDQISNTQKDLQHSQDVFKQIIDFSSKLGIPTELNEIYRNCLHLFKELLDLDVTTLFLVTAEQDRLMVYDTLGFPESVVGTFSVSKGVGLPGLVWETLQVESVEDFHTEKRFKVPDVIFQNNLTSAIATPLLHNNQLFGVIAGHSRNNILFSEEEKGLAQIFANQSATAIKNATHIKSLRISEQKLSQRTNEFETIFSNSMAGIMLIKGGRILARCNQRLADFMGYDSPEELKGISMKKFHLSEEQFLDFGKRYYETLVSGEQVQVTYQLRKKDGHPIWCTLSGKATDQSSPPDLQKGVVWVVDDISQRKKMEEQILKNQKLESIEILTGGLAHDFNNIITAILGNISLSMATIDPESAGYSFLLPAKEASLRAKDLTQKLQAFAKDSAPVRRMTSLTDIITDAVDSVLSKSPIQVEYQFDEDLWQANIDAHQIKKVVEILLTNSKQAMGNQGTITVSCCKYQNRGKITELKADHYVRIMITDTGHGIAPENMAKIFDPYFTTRTRDSKKGRGLGLATAHSIVKRHKGFISITSIEKSGTTAILYIAASPAKGRNESKNEQKPSVVHAKGKKVLIMDDDESIRDLFQQTLTLLGYKVDMAEDGAEAIELYRRYMNTEQQFNVIIMDLTVPGGMGGADAVQEILKIDNNAKVIVSSGDSHDPAMTDFENYGFVASVKKPFELTELNRTLSSVFNKPTALQ